MNKMADKELKILLIEDNPGDVRLIKEMLKDQNVINFFFKTEKNLISGLKILKKEEIDLLLLDLGLPDSVGLITLKKIIDEGFNIPIIIITGLHNQAQGVEAVKMGAQGFLTKGEFNENLLVQSIQFAVERYALKEKINHINQVLFAVRKINQLIIHERDHDILLTNACEILIKTKGYLNAWIGLLNESNKIETFFEAGLGKNFLKIKNLFENGDITRCGRKTLQSSDILIINDPISECTNCPISKLYHNRGGLAIRLEHSGKVFGFIAVSLLKDMCQNEEEINLFQELAGDISFALHNIDVENKHMEAEEKVRKNEEILCNFLHSATDNILLFDSKMNCININIAALKYYTAETKKENVIGKHILEIFPDLKKSSRYNNYIDVIKRENPFYTEDIIPHSKFVDKYIAVRAFKVGDGLGMITTDITERKKVENALKEKEKILSQIINRNPTPIFVINDEHIITHWNKACEILTGLSETEMIGTNNQWKIFYSKKTPILVDLLIENLSKNERKEELEKYYKKKVVQSSLIDDGYESEDFFPNMGKKGKWLYFTGASLKDKNGKIIGAIQTFDDITEYKQIEEKLKSHSLGLENMIEKRTIELEVAQNELLRKEKLSLLGKIAGSIGHDLRNPLSVISNSIYFLTMKLKNVDEKIKKHLNIIQREVNRSKEMLSELLGFARIKTPNFQKVNVNNIIKMTLENVELLENIVLEKNLDIKLPNIKADPLQLQRIFQNLISNAIQAMPEGGTLTITTQTIDKMCEIKFKDSGIGIPKENLNKIFEPLFSTKAKGIGLGLSTVKEILEMHKSDIEVKSEIGKGSTFIIRLPIQNRDGI